jgi:hypothetical protein
VTRAGVDRVSLAAGIACLLVGALLGLDQLGVAIAPELIGAAICAGAGAVLVVSGLEPPRDRRKDG